MTKILARRFSALLIIFTLVFSCATGVFAAEKTITVLLNGNLLEFDVNPVLENGRTLVPMRTIFEALGAEVDWDDETWTAIATKGDTKIEIAIDSNQMLKNGEIVTLDVPARLKDSRTLVPVRAVSEGLGAKVDWDDALWQVIITTDTEIYDFSELSPSDKEALISEKGTLRYYFEQMLLPSTFLSGAEYAATLIDENSSDLPELTHYFWEDLLIPYIMNLQIESKDQYIFDNAAEFSEDALYGIYAGIINDAGLGSDELFSADYDVTPSGKKLLLVTFNTADEPLNCKYIAMVAHDNTTRCFTAETTLSETADTAYTLYEITLEDRGSYFVVEDKTQFLKGIDSVISSGEAPSASRSRPLDN